MKKTASLVLAAFLFLASGLVRAEVEEVHVSPVKRPCICLPTV